MTRADGSDHHCLPGYAALGRLGHSRGDLELRLRLLVTQLAAELSGCGWCIGRAQHQSLQAGLPSETLGAVRDWAASPVFAERERAALALVDALTRYSAREGGISRQVMETARRHFSGSEIAEITVAATAEHFFDPATGALGAEVERPDRISRQPLP